MAKKILIIFLLSSFCMNAQYTAPNKKREDAWLKIGIGAYMHALSCVFMTPELRPTTKQAFIYMNIATVQIDIIGIIQLRKNKKKKI